MVVDPELKYIIILEKQSTITRFHFYRIHTRDDGSYYISSRAGAFDIQYTIDVNHDVNFLGKFGYIRGGQEIFEIFYDESKSEYTMYSRQQLWNCVPKGIKYNTNLNFRSLRNTEATYNIDYT